jgi:hypothetical protein
VCGLRMFAAKNSRKRSEARSLVDRGALGQCVVHGRCPLERIDRSHIESASKGSVTYSFTRLPCGLPWPSSTPTIRSDIGYVWLKFGARQTGSIRFEGCGSFRGGDFPNLLGSGSPALPA